MFIYITFFNPINNLELKHSSYLANDPDWEKSSDLDTYFDNQKLLRQSEMDTDFERQRI